MAGRLPRGGSLDAPNSGRLGEGFPIGARGGFASIPGVLGVACQYQQQTYNNNVTKTIEE